MNANRDPIQCAVLGQLKEWLGFSYNGQNLLASLLALDRADLADHILRGGYPVDENNKGQARASLAWAAATNRVDATKFLLRHGADVNGPSFQDVSPLHEAAAKSNLEVVRLLIDAGANVNHTGSYGSTPLDECTADDVREVLLKAGGRSGREPD